jgi:DNA polymerase I-like protein with 3'-5' exonuclease and polymerase domains
MQADLKSRGLDALFDCYMKNLMPKCQNMINNGILISESKLEATKLELQSELDSAIESLDRQTEDRLQRKINPNSPKQVKEALKELKIKVPTKKGSETVNKEALVKMRKAYPKETVLSDLIKVSKLSSQLDTYFNFNYDKDSRLRFSVDAFHNEYGEWNSSKNPFESGFSLEETPRKTKGFMIADEGKQFLEIRLHIPEQVYLAYDSGDSRMMNVIQKHDSITKQLAAQMFKRGVDIVHEKSIEARVALLALTEAAYGSSPRAFATKAMGELGFSMNEIEARRYLNIVFELFPNLRKRQEKIKDKLASSRTLVNALGRSIVYYDRINDELLKKAYQWGFRSLHADVLNHLMAGFKQNDYVVRTNSTILVQTENEDHSYDLIRDIEKNEWQPVIKSIYANYQFMPRFRIGSSWGVMRDV